MHRWRFTIQIATLRHIHLLNLLVEGAQGPITINSGAGPKGTVVVEGTGDPPPGPILMGMDIRRYPPTEGEVARVAWAWNFDGSPNGDWDTMVCWLEEWFGDPLSERRAATSEHQSG